jgi:hypothetical protein
VATAASSTNESDNSNVSAQICCVVESFMPEYPLKKRRVHEAPGGRNVLLV